MKPPKREAWISTDFPLPPNETIVRIIVSRGKNLTPLESDLLITLIDDYLIGIGCDSLHTEAEIYKRADKEIEADAGMMAAFMKKKGRWVRVSNGVRGIDRNKNII
jgi:hypothetical protein